MSTGIPLPPIWALVVCSAVTFTLTFTFTQTETNSELVFLGVPASLKVLLSVTSPCAVFLKVNW